MAMVQAKTAEHKSKCSRGVNKYFSSGELHLPRIGVTLPHGWRLGMVTAARMPEDVRKGSSGRKMAE
jgi:hypothetical protein